MDEYWNNWKEDYLTTKVKQQIPFYLMEYVDEDGEERSILFASQDGLKRWMYKLITEFIANKPNEENKQFNVLKDNSWMSVEEMMNIANQLKMGVVFNHHKYFNNGGQ
tara:strand:+ start:1731 stop:2054 length:324 start_codon:yes stop_codon:yes gene_type:complete